MGMLTLIRRAQNRLVFVLHNSCGLFVIVLNSPHELCVIHLEGYLNLIPGIHTFITNVTILLLQIVHLNMFMKNCISDF